MSQIHTLLEPPKPATRLEKSGVTIRWSVFLGLLSGFGYYVVQSFAESRGYRFGAPPSPLAWWIDPEIWKSFTSGGVAVVPLIAAWAFNKFPFLSPIKSWFAGNGAQLREIKELLQQLLAAIQKLDLPKKT